jgi:uncharacterized protein (TIGR02145 family)
MKTNHTIKLVGIFMVFCINGIKAQQETQSTKLMDALKNENLSEATSLVQNIDSVNQKDMEGNNLLMLASNIGYTEVCQILLSKGAKVDLQSDDGGTALMLASQGGFIEIVKLLLDRGANVDLQTDFGETALMLASQNKQTEIAKLLLDKSLNLDLKTNNGVTALMYASINGDVEIVKLLLDKGVQIDLKDSDKQTSLILASLYGNIEVIKLLLDKGAQIDLKEKDGKTALMVASLFGYTEKVKTLLDKGARLNIQSESGETALFYALECDDKLAAADIVMLLSEKGAQLDLKEDGGLTALMVAAQKGNIENVKILVDNGAKLDLQDNDGKTALMLASQKNYYYGCYYDDETKRLTEVIKLLLDKGANPDIKSNEGKTAYDYAINPWLKFELNVDFKYTKSLPVTDIDGNEYHTIIIGSQIWIVENLRTTRFNDGTKIPMVSVDKLWGKTTSPAYCWQNNDSVNNKSVYGALYNWYAVNTNKLCPAGWHAPADKEWITLGKDALGDKYGANELKERGNIHWQNYDEGGNNVSGFTALPGGDRLDIGTFEKLGETGFFWSITEYDRHNGLACTIEWNHVNMFIIINKQNGYSVRCLKDN